MVEAPPSNKAAYISHKRQLSDPNLKSDYNGQKNIKDLMQAHGNANGDDFERAFAGFATENLWKTGWVTIGTSLKLGTSDWTLWFVDPGVETEFRIFRNDSEYYYFILLESIATFGFLVYGFLLFLIAPRNIALQLIPITSSVGALCAFFIVVALTRRNWARRYHHAMVAFGIWFVLLTYFGGIILFTDVVKWKEGPTVYVWSTLVFMTFSISFYPILFSHAFMSRQVFGVVLFSGIWPLALSFNLNDISVHGSDNTLAVALQGASNDDGVDLDENVEGCSENDENAIADMDQVERKDISTVVVDQYSREEPDMSSRGFEELETRKSTMKSSRKGFESARGNSLRLPTLSKAKSRSIRSMDSLELLEAAKKLKEDIERNDIAVGADRAQAIQKSVSSHRTARSTKKRVAPDLEQDLAGLPVMNADPLLESNSALGIRTDPVLKSEDTLPKVSSEVIPASKSASPEANTQASSLDRSRLTYIWGLLLTAIGEANRTQAWRRDGNWKMEWAFEQWKMKSFYVRLSVKCQNPGAQFSPLCNDQSTIIRNFRIGYAIVPVIASVLLYLKPPVKVAQMLHLLVEMFRSSGIM
ncbi:hypothetical protein HDU97_001341 [Phlyctochytrium planicorne]|nr:hypothetical protein HDU97_001341 [Phlyctochytrium planicorne]